MIKIGNKIIGDKPYIIAEAGVNHMNSLDLAKKLVEAAALAGADAIKFQTYTADELVVKNTPKFWDWEGDKHYRNQYEAYEALGNFPLAFYPGLIKHCEENQIEFLSTPFSIKAADMLNSLGMKAFKIASSDMSTLPFLEHVARFNKPILLSTGAATEEEIMEAVTTIEDAGNSNIILLHCVLCYPTKNEDANLNIIDSLKCTFPQYPIGISDHTRGVFPSLVALAKGVAVLEKHFTVDKTLPNSADHWLSVDPTELKEIVQGAKDIHLLSGSKEKIIFDCEEETRKYDKRSIVSKIDIRKGNIIQEDMITYKRPGTGIWPKFNSLIIGKRAIVDIPADTTITWIMISS